MKILEPENNLCRRTGKDQQYEQYFSQDQCKKISGCSRGAGEDRADDLGLGAVWMGISLDETRMNAVRNVLNIPEHLHAFALVPCGYPAEEREQRKTGTTRAGCIIFKKGKLIW